MFSIVRAAGFAAAVIGAALAPTLADPSLAFGGETTQAAAATYIDHATAQIDPTAPQANELQAFPETSQDPDPVEPVAQHAVATVTETPSPLVKTEEKQVPRQLSSLVDAYARTDVADSDMECLAGAIYFESKGEPLAGQLAVAEVIINRSQSGKYPRSLCGVVKQPSQFSFVRGGRIPAIPRDSAHWRKAVAIAHIAVNDLADSPAPQALSFHATRVSPNWNMKRVARVGNHVFYR
jgi:spore germination cell wall hydrolase CwlJ-like protein